MKFSFVKYLSVLFLILITACTVSAKSNDDEVFDIEIKNVSDISKTYDGDAVSIPSYTVLLTSGEEIDDSKLGKVEIAFKLQDQSDSSYEQTAPINAGDYKFRISISSSSAYSSCSYEANFSIAKAIPTEDNYTLPDNIASIKGDKLSSIDISSYNLVWEDANVELLETGSYAVVFNSDPLSKHYNSNYTSLSGLYVNVKCVSNLVNIPSIEKSFTYTGEEKAITESDISSYDSSSMQIIQAKSTMSATNAGSYSVCIGFLDSENSCWNDRTFGEKNINWSISKAQAQEYSGEAIIFNGTYSKDKTLASYSLSPYENVYWKDDTIVPTCDITSYAVVYNVDAINYEDYEFEATINLQKADPEFTAPTGLSAQDGTSLSTVVLPSSKNGVFSWTDGSTKVSSDVSSYSCTFTPNDTVNYNVIVFNIEISVNDYTFTITYTSGTKNCYTVTQNSDSGEYVVTFANMSADTVYSISGVLNGGILINGNDNYKFTLNLNSISITSKTTSPIIALSGDKITLVANNSTTNTITDNRDAISDDDETNYSACIYSAVDLTLSGSGVLNVVSSNNNGIHTKDDLKSSNLKLNVNCVDNALKGNDSVTISSGNYVLISKQGDAIKTKNSAVKYNTSGDSTSGIKKIQGDITISGGTFEIHAGSDGIDASHDVLISSSPTIDIYTSTTYSSQVETATSTSSGTIYIRSNTTSYKYSIYYYNSSSDYVWKNSSSYKTVTSTQMGGGGPGSMGGGFQSTYYYYPISKPSGYSNIIVYVYSSSQSQGQSSTYYKCSDKMTINSAYDTIAFSSSSSSSRPGPSSTGQSSFNWTNYGDSSYSMKGIKADNEVSISGGTISIKSYDDAIHANNDTVLGDEDDTSDDYYGNGNVTISGGNITINTKDDGVHADQDLTISGGTLNIETSYEGIEANRIYIKGGESYIYATDDAANAAVCNGSYTPLFSMSDGYLDLDVSSGDTDTLDSNGTVKVTGGVLIAKNRQTRSTSQTGGTFDVDGNMSISGGYVASIGCWCSEASMTANISSTSTTLSSGSYSVKKSSGTELFSFELSTSYYGYRIYAGQSCSLYRGSTKIN